MNSYFKLAQRADLGLGLVFAVLTVYCLITQSYLMAGMWALSSAVSFISAKVVPARWVVSRVLSRRLKA